MLNNSLGFVIAVVIAYFLGNISPSILLGRAMGIDIKKEGSGNAGTTNALRVMGKKAGIITLVIDILKGFIAVELGFLIAGHQAGLVCALMAFLGHIFPVCFHFKGGKGVAVAFGALLGVNWMLALTALAVVVVVVAVFRMVSLGSILAALSFPFACWYFQPDFICIGCVMALILLWAHRGNIKRLLKGEENKLSFKK